MRAMIVDDEPLARRELRRLLAEFPWVEIVAEAGNIAEAAKEIDASTPELLFLDIKMPGGTGFDLLARLEHVPRVIFTTAYDDHAVQAFEVNALDYLLKPVAPDRLAVTVSRLAAAPPPTAPRGQVSYDDRLFLRLGQERAFVRVRDIVAIEAEGDGSTLRLAPQLTRRPSVKSLREWEQRLPDRQFVRIHRSTIVNLEYVERLEPWSHSSQHVYLRGVPEPLSMSRRFATRLRDRFG
jgi:two-component system LytT family response regulator